MVTLNVQLQMIKKDNGDYGITFMGEEVISFCESVYKTDGDKIYDALVKMFGCGLEMGSGVSIDKA